MAKIFSQNQLSQRELYEQKYRTSRINLLIVVIFTMVNVILLVTNADMYFLFSAFLPYYIAGIGMLLCGRFPDDYYTDGLEGMVFLDNSFFVITLVIAIVLVLVYLLAWFMSSKNRVGWLIFMLVFFGIDTLLMLVLGGISFDSVINILFHAWVIYYLILGINSHFKLKKLPPEEEPIPSDAAPQPIPEGGEAPESGSDDAPSESASGETYDSPVIRKADKNVKSRILAEARAFDYSIRYRRVKHTNELVINGNVYDEISGVIERPHVLAATLDGHCIEAGYNGTHSLIVVDGKIIAKKIRLF